ncbi:MAG: helix-turn-helix domain-containing protein [Acidimicrobiia bacterium]|nr:helix-turn-helix domain-containing protein [Acidimicrobiia bacterium]
MEIRTALKALADETRYAVYEEIATATTPLSAAELAERLGFHPNTVRLHLERLRETGLVDVEAAHRGSVGRPQHLYTLAAGAPGVVLQPAVQVVLAGLLADLAERAGAGIELAQATGRVWGTEAGRRARERSCVEALTTELDGLGFEPDLHQAGGGGLDSVPGLPVPGAGRGIS